MSPPLEEARDAVVADLLMLTTYDVAEILRVPERAVARMIRKGTLIPTKTIGAIHRFSREDLRRWMDSQDAKASVATAEPAGVARA